VTTLHAITVLGHDRPGIIAETTDRLAALGLNLEDSTMTLLRGHFAMMLIARGDVSAADLENALWELTQDGRLDVTVREVPEQAMPESGADWVLTVHGGDRPGIVSGVVAKVAEVGGNIIELATRLSGDLYLLVAEIQMPTGADTEALAATIAETAAELGVEASLRPVDTDEL
jgi:glycine cleavage system transcriptional repressor